MDVTARRLGWTQADGLPEYVSGELVILDDEAGLSVAASPLKAPEGDRGDGLSVAAGPPGAPVADGADTAGGRDPAATSYAVHLVGGYAVDPESVVALRWAEIHPTQCPRP